MALSATGEGCHKEMSVILDDLVNGILVFLKDSVGLEVLTLLSLHSLSASSGSVRCLQRSRSNVHGLPRNLPEEVPRQGHSGSPVDLRRSRPSEDSSPRRRRPGELLRGLSPALARRTSSSDHREARTSSQPEISRSRRREEKRAVDADRLSLSLARSSQPQTSPRTNRHHPRRHRRHRRTRLLAVLRPVSRERRARTDQISFLADSCPS